MHAGQNDDVGLGLDGPARERQRVADDIGDAMEDLRRLVVMRQDHRVALLLQAVDGVHIGRVERPFDFGDHGPDALVDRRGRGRDVGCVAGGLCE